MIAGGEPVISVSVRKVFIDITFDRWGWHSQGFLQSPTAHSPSPGSLISEPTELRPVLLGSHLPLTLCEETGSSQKQMKKAGASHHVVRGAVSVQSTHCFPALPYTRMWEGCLPEKCRPLPRIAVDVSLHYCRCAGRHCLDCCTGKGRRSPADRELPTFVWISH